VKGSVATFPLSLESIEHEVKQKALGDDFRGLEGVFLDDILIL
jgi:hypothetical protein